jgi:uncharacterized OsmC-like protein
MGDQAVVSWSGGVRFDAETRGHRMTIDQPRDEGGTDEGMTPLECLAVSLGSCVAYFAARFAQRHALPIRDLQVTTAWDYAEQPHRVGRFDVRIVYRGALDAAMRDRLQRVVEGCTVHHTLTHPPQIRVALSADEEGVMTHGPEAGGGGA